MKKLTYLILSSLGLILIGGYIHATVYKVQDVEVHQWILTCLFTLYFIISYNKSVKNETN